MKAYVKPLVAFTALLIFAADGMAESHTANKQASDKYIASAKINLRVVIPEVLLFQSSDSVTSLDTLAFPTSIQAHTANGNLVLHGNTGPAGIVTEVETAVEITYTAVSL